MALLYEFQGLPFTWYPVPAGWANGTIGSLALAIANDGVLEGPELFQFLIYSADPGVVGLGTQNITIANGSSGFAGQMSGVATEGGGLPTPTPNAAASSRPPPKKGDFGKWFNDGVPPVTATSPTWRRAP